MRIEVAIVIPASEAAVASVTMAQTRKRRIAAVINRALLTGLDDAGAGVAKIVDGVGTGSGMRKGKTREGMIVMMRRTRARL